MAANRLILMRHASASSGTNRDFDRPLARRGLSEAHGVGARLRALGAVPDRILASSARRCRETVEALASGLGAQTPPASAIAFSERLYNASTHDLLEAIRSLDAAQTLLVVAHNPGISLLALELGRRQHDQEDALRAGFVPATIAIFEVDPPWSSLGDGAACLLALERPAPERD